MAILLTLLAATAATVPLNPAPVNSYQVRVGASADSDRVVSVKGPNLTRVYYPGTESPLAITRGDTSYLRRTATSGGSILLNQPPAQPDGFPAWADEWTEATDSILARARSGEALLTATTHSGTPAVTTTVRLPANECAGLPRRDATFTLSQAHFLLFQVKQRAVGTGEEINEVNYRYTRVNGALSAALFAPPPTAGPRRFVTNGGFKRVAPKVAAGPLPYVPREPTVLPAGYRRVLTGWAPRGGLLGPEGSIARMRWLYQASWRNGQERMDFTMRVSSTDWPVDPFAHECQAVEQEQVQIGTVTGTYGSGATSTPHLFWRDGPILYTLSAPVSKELLVRVAASLQKVQT